MKNQRTTGELRQCKLPGCPAKFLVPVSAENKAFCCASHRLAWHGQERQQAMQMLRDQQSRCSQDSLGSQEKGKP